MKKIVKNGESNVTVIDSQVVELEAHIISKHDQVSQMDTPAVYVKQQQGFDYVDEGYMRHMLNLYFPLWKWEIIKYEFIGDKSIAVHGRLTIMDNGVERHFDAIDAHRVASNEKGYVDIGNDLKSANTDCFKVAVNRLCNVADDVYRKRIEDISLDDEEIKSIKVKLKMVKDKKVVSKIEKSIDSMLINKKNMDATMRRLDVIIGEQ